MPRQNHGVRNHGHAPTMGKCIVLCLLATLAVFIEPLNAFNPTRQTPLNLQTRLSHKTRRLNILSFNQLSFTRDLSLQSSPNNNPESPYPEPRVYPQRYTQLAYLSLLALLSDWICFSLAASPSSFEAAYPDSNAAHIIDIFLFTNVASCFLVTDVVARFGLGKCIKGAAAIMTVGCLLRSGLPDVSFLANALGDGDTVSATISPGIDSSAIVQAVTEALPDPISNLVSTDSLTEASRSAGLEPYPLLVLGTVLVGFAQPVSCSVL